MSNKNNQQVNKVPRMTGPRRGGGRAPHGTYGSQKSLRTLKSPWLIY